MYDPRENRIIIDGEDKTDSVERCWYTSRPNRCHVIFCNFPKTYSYVPSKVLWLKDPVVFDPQHCHLLHKGRRIEPLSYIAAFQQGSRRFWYVEYANGTGAHYKGSEVELVRSCLEEPPAQDRFAYLREVAELNPLKTDDGQKLLLMQYQKIDFVSDRSAAALYLNPGKDSPRQFPVPQLIYPFGCNASQQRAIQAAFGNQISIIQGPPGTGKTLLAKAVAGEAGVPFFSISGSEFVEMFVGRGAAKVRDLFQQAREKAPCIVFIDEIDTIGKKRDGAGFSGNDEREQTLNQLLAEMDGFDGSKGVVILAATNRPESLDPALLRPGRFDRRIPVELPDLAGREAILRVHAKNVKCSPSVDFNAIARASAGASGAELANMVNEAALLAVKDGRRSVVQKDLEEAIETVIAGYQKKGAVISNKEKLIVSYHEIGHALVAALTKGSAPVHKITIVPRTSGALGYTMQVEEGEQHLMTKDEAYSRIMTLTGGRCAEELIFDSITSGASNDIEQATKLARSMVTRLGMSDTFGMTALETVNNQYLGGDTSLACSAETAAKVDEEVVKLIRKAHDEAKELLKNNMSKLHELAKYLYDHETITGEEFMEILQKSA